mmetsp:Transcript_13892/g.58837  ORF Transcript_13892/g.58837 Transcript_13892/m.58837 type:complete len:221 (-) Transcript_13892:1282-1944(-)
MTQTSAVRAPLCAGERHEFRLLVHRVVQHRKHGRDPLLRLAQQVLEVQQDRFRLVLVDERGGDPRLTAATGAADAVDVVFNLLGHVVVDDVLDVRKVQTLSGDVGCDQHVLALRLELADRPVALVLTLPAMNSHSLHPLQQQVLVDVVDVAFVLAEDQHGRRGLLEALQKVHDLSLLLDVLDLLNDVQVCCARAAHVDHDGVHESRLSKLPDLLRHRRRE